VSRPLTAKRGLDAARTSAALWLQAFANRTILDLISECKIKLRNRRRAGAAVLVKQASAIVNYSGAHTKSDWLSFMNHTTKMGLLTRIRNSQ
jgi:hypothetical protein